MKIVLPLAGKGSRLMPHTQMIPKPLMPVAGRCIIDYLMDDLIQLNPSEFIFIIGHLKDHVENYLREKYSNYSLSFVEQNNPQGLGHAIYQARHNFVEDEDMLVILGDQTFSIDWEKMLQKDSNRLSIIKVVNPQLFGIVTIGEDGFVSTMEEKPSSPKSNLAISGTYYFQSAQKVFSTLSYQIDQDIRTRGEIQITDSMRLMMEKGEKFQVLEIFDWNDCGNHRDLLKANQTLLQKFSQRSSYDDTVKIIEPVWIDPSVSIKNSIVGPNVSLSKNVALLNVKLENSILCENVSLINSSLKDSYVGYNVNIENINASNQYLI